MSGDLEQRLGVPDRDGRLTAALSAERSRLRPPGHSCCVCARLSTRQAACGTISAIRYASRGSDR
jgi:hypothetical protein